MKVQEPTSVSAWAGMSGDPASGLIQSTELPPDSTEMHRSVVGGGSSTPHRRVMAASAPHATVACAVVEPWTLPASSSGSAWITAAHTGSGADGPGWRCTLAAHPASGSTRHREDTRARMSQLYGGGMGTVRVRDMDEEGLLASFTPLLPQGDAEVPNGDDAAVVPLSEPRFVVTTDVLVEGRHFTRAWSTGADVGWRVIMQNAADVGAMGAAPVAFVAAVVLPGDLEVAWVRELATGMADACAAVTSRTGVACGVVGGDLSSGDDIVVAVTAHGDLLGRPPVLRSGARVGDVVAHAGTLGYSAAGLAALRAGHAHEAALAVHRRPTPPLDAALAAARGGAHALMDVSDGLLRDAGRMARASGVTFDLRLPVDEVLVALARDLGEDPRAWVAGGGEDHGFLATFAPGGVPDGFEQVGVVRHAGADPVLLDGAPPLLAVGWDHFRRG